MSTSTLIFPPERCSTVTINTYRLDASTKYSATVFMANKAGTIDRVSIRLSSKAGSPGTLRVGLQGISDGPIPDGTWLASGNAYYDITSPVTGRTTVTLGSSVTVTAGQMFTAVVTPQSGTWDGSNYIEVGYNYPTCMSSMLLPNGMYYSGSAWTRSSGLAIVAPLYDDGTIIPGSTLVSSATSLVSSWTSSANPLYKGNKWVATCDCVLRNLWPYFRVDTSQLSDVNIKVFKDSSTTPIFTQAVDAAQVMRTGSLQIPMVPCNDLALVKDSTYRFVIEPTSSTVLNTCYRQDYDTAADRLACVGDLIYTTAPSGATSWTDTDTQCGPIWPEIYSVDSGSGGALVQQAHAMTGIWSM